MDDTAACYGDDYEEDEEQDFEEVEEGDFDVSLFVESEDGNGEDKAKNNLTEESSSATSKKVQDEDPEETEEKLKKLGEIFSCLPPVLIRRVLNRDDVNGNVERASQRLQEFQDMEDPLDLFKNPATPEPLTGTGEKTSSRGTDQPKNVRGKKWRSTFQSDNDMPKEHGEIRDLRRYSFDDTRAENRGGCQGNRGQNARQRGGPRGRPRGTPWGAPRGGFGQGQSDYQGFRDNDIGLPQGCGFGGEDSFQQQRGHRNRGGRGHPPKPKPRKNRGRGYRGRGINYQTPDEGLHYEDQFSQLNQRQQRYPEKGGASQHNQRRREVRGRNGVPSHPSDLTDGNAVRPSVNDDSLLGSFGGENPSRRSQGNRGRPRDSGNKERGRGGMRRAQSLSSVMESGDQNVDQGRSNAKEQSQFERNQLLVCGLSALTTEECVTNFIEVMSGGEVKDVILRNDKALITMTSDITDFRRIKTKGEKRGLNSAKVTIEQVPVCTSIIVSGISDNTTHDAIELHFESPRNSGGPVETVHFVPKSGRAVVVFQDPRDMERVLARQEEKPHVLNKAQLSIRIYNEFLESEEGDLPDDSGGLGATAGSTDQTQVSQQSKAKTQQLHIAIDPDVMEFVTTSAFRDRLSNSLAAKRSEITWKPNNKMAVIVYHGGDESDSWQPGCIDEVQNYLGKFAKRDVQVNKDFWDAVVARSSSISACLGVDPPLVKLIEDSFVARIVSLSTDVKDSEEKLKSKLEEIYREETRKTYLKKKVPNVSEERLILLKKIKFVEKLQEKNKELEIKLDTEGEEIYFEGPQSQFTEATMKFYKQMSDMVEKTLTLSDRILEVLGSEEGLKKVKCELKNNNVEAVFVIDKDARIVGTSAAHADNAARLVNKLILEEKVQVDEKSKYLLKSADWRKLCDEINSETAVRIHRNNWNDTYVAGFRDDVIEVMKKLNNFLESNCIRNERFVCSSQIVRSYLAELRQEDLHSIENQLKDFEVKIKKGKGDDDFDISGNKEGLTRARRKLDALVKDTVSETFEVKQPGLRKYFDSGKGDHLVKSVEKDHSCAIQVQRNFGQRRHDLDRQAAASSESDDDDSDVGDDDEDEDDAAARGSDASALVMTQGHRISWRPGNIETEKADVLVSSVGASYQAIVNAGVPAMTNPNVGDITVNSGLPLTNHVIHTNCCQWQGGKGEATLKAIVQKSLQKGEQLGAKSIAFPVIGTGKLGFPHDAASRIMLEETSSFCQASPASNVRDIRFVVFQGDQALTAAFKHEMDKLRAKHKLRPAYTMRKFFSNIRSRYRQRVPVSPERARIEVVRGNLCQEITDAIVNITSKEMNMDSAGALSKAVKQASGPQVEAECNQLGQQSGGSAVITSGGNLPARHIIHMIPDSARKDHLQQCVEKCLRLAETKGLQSISIPAIGTGAFGLSAADSASLIFQALGNFKRSFNTVRKVRIVVFQPKMLQVFQQEHQRHSSYSSRGTTSPIGKDLSFNVEVVNGDLTQEQTDAIMNINSTDMNMNNAGELSKAIANKSGPQVQQECNQLGKQSAGSAVMTSGGNLNIPHIIHIVPGSSDKQHLQQCLEEGLRVADTNNLRSISIPSVGTGGYGLAAADSAQITFQALNNFSGSCKSVRKVRVVVFQAQMMQEFLQEQQGNPMQDLEEEESGSSSDEIDADESTMPVRSPLQQANLDHSVRICVIGKRKAVVDKAVESLKKGFSEACTTEKVENEVIRQLSHKQIVSLRRKAEDRDVKLVVEADVDRIVVRGQPTEVSSMVGEIWKEIGERIKKTQEEEQAQLVSRNVEWSYEIRSTKLAFGRKANAKIEMACSKDEPRVQISLRGEQFVIDLKAKTGRGQRTGDQITLTRKVKGAEEGTALPQHWAPMPSSATVHKVQLLPGSTEYQDVLRKMQATTGAIPVQKIERVQNPHLYQSYMVRKQKMDKDTGGNSERQLFHGTDAKNISHINTQGFNRSFCGAHGTSYGRGVYFARDAQYSVGYASGGAGSRYMYLARVLVGQYCLGNGAMIVPPPKNPSKPEILYDSVVNNMGNPGMFVVFFDNQCYPEYLITF